MKISTINRTGTRAAAERLEEMLEIDDLSTSGPIPEGELSADEVRVQAIIAAGPLGSKIDMPEPSSNVALLDHLGARLAFERGGTRLYDALLRKAESLASGLGLDDCVADLRHIRQEEAEHALMLMGLIRELDGDPTMETPCADLEGVLSSGLMQAVNDPRTTLAQCLHAALVAELADIEAWSTLLNLGGGALTSEQAELVREAAEHEQEHLVMVRKWLLEAQQQERSLGTSLKPRSGRRSMESRG
jgi:rubrerythrin